MIFSAKMPVLLALKSSPANCQCCLRTVTVVVYYHDDFLGLSDHLRTILLTATLLMVTILVTDQKDHQGAGVMDRVVVVLQETEVQEVLVQVQQDVQDVLKVLDVLEVLDGTTENRIGISVFKFQAMSRSLRTQACLEQGPIVSNYL